MSAKGYFSVLRWRADLTRDEAKNVAVILVGDSGEFAALRAAPLSSISPRLHEQGLLDAMLLGLEQRLSSEAKPTSKDLHGLHESLQRSVYLTEPRPVSVSDVDAVMNALYRAYVAPRAVGGGRAATKGAVLDRVVAGLRGQGLTVRRGEYVADFLFDAVIEGSQRSAVEVLSFATAAINWTPAEYDAGHFLYALERVSLKGLAVVQPPSETSHPNALAAHERVSRWFENAGVRTFGLQEVTQAQLVLSG